MTRWMHADCLNGPRTKTLTPQLTKVAEITEKGGPDVEVRLEALYKRIYFIGLVGRLVLRALGLLRKIKLDPTLFDQHRETV